MRHTVKTAEKSTVKIKMTFSAEEWNEAVNKAYIKMKGKFAINGFRKGKAPKNVIEHAYGKGVFYEEAINTLFNENYGKVLEKDAEKYTAVGEPNVDIESIDDNGVVMTAVVPVKPEVKIESYKGMKIKEFAYNVKDEDIDKELERVRDRNARKVEVTDRAAQNGDIVVIDFVGTVDGVKFAGGEAEDYELTLGSNTFIPGFEDQVVGMNLNDKKDVAVRFPDNYQAENLKGKDAVFAVTLHKIEGKELPEVTDEFIKDATGSENLEEYKAKTRTRLEEQAKRTALDKTENSILEAIAEKSSAEIPDAMIDSEIDNLVKKFEYQLMYQGLKLSDYLDFIKVTEEDFRKNYAEQAKKNVLSQLIISQIIKDENISASDEEVEEKVAEQAKSVEKTAEEYKKTMDPRQLDYIKSDIIITKLFDFLKANNEMVLEEDK